VTHLEIFDNHGERCREQHNLAVFWVESEQLLYDRSEFGGEELVGFVHDKGLAGRQIGHPFAGQIENAPRGADNNVDGLIQTHNVVSQPSTTSTDHHIHAKMFSNRLAHLGCLQSQFAGGDQDEGLNAVVLRVDTMQRRDHIGGGLASAVFRTGEDVARSQGHWYRLFLDGRRLFKARLKDAHLKLSAKVEVVPLQASCRSDIFGLRSCVFWGGFGVWEFGRCGC
jgi:hypothetical protein